jgi:3'-5' exoribonuclease
MLVRDFIDGAEIDAVLLVRAVEVGPRHDGVEELKLTLADRTGEVTACIHGQDCREVASRLEASTPVRVIGRFADDPRYGARVTIRALHTPDPSTFSLTDLRDGPHRAAEQLEADLRALVATVQQPYLRELLDRFVGEASPLWPHFRDAPAAKRFHHAYQHGLLEHSLSVAQAVSAISATFPGIDRDVAVTGALLHDIGKLDAYMADEHGFGLSDAGRLQGEIPLGYYRVRREIELIDGFPARLAEAVVHIILSHHGSLEHGSPVVPCTREATLVHFVDNLGGRLGSFDRLERELPEGAVWSAYDRALGGGAAYFGTRDERERAARAA